MHSERLHLTVLIGHLIATAAESGAQETAEEIVMSAWVDGVFHCQIIAFYRHLIHTKTSPVPVLLTIVPTMASSMSEANTMNMQPNIHTSIAFT